MKALNDLFDEIAALRHLIEACDNALRLIRRHAEEVERLLAEEGYAVDGDSTRTAPEDPGTALYDF